MSSTLPTWAVYCVSFGTPAAAFFGTWLGSRVARKGAKELEKRSRREQPCATSGGPPSVTDFAGDSHTANAWAADLYRRARDRGHDHPHAVRILARAWLHVIWRCWQDRVAYDPTKHRALQRISATAA